VKVFNWLEDRTLEPKFGILGSGLINLGLCLAVFLAVWRIFMDPSGYLRMYTPMYGYSYIQWFLVAILFNVLVFKFWPLSRSFMVDKHPLLRSGVLLAINILFVLFVIKVIFQTVLGTMGLPYFSEDVLASLKINPFNAREYSSAAILFMGGMCGLIIPIWALHLDNWPGREIPRFLGYLTSFLLIMFFVVAGFILLLHPHFGIIFYPWQKFAAAFPWWEPTFGTLSGQFNLGWMMCWTSALWILVVTYEGYPFKLIEKPFWRAIAGILGSLLLGIVFYTTFYLLQELAWGPSVRGSRLVLAAEWRYLHAGEIAMFMLLISLLLGHYFGNWPKNFSKEVNFLVRTFIICIGTVAFYNLYYKYSPPILGTQAGYASPMQFPLASLSLFVGLLLVHSWYLDRWPAEKLVIAPATERSEMDTA
jgi:amino acid transporter, AAT family